MLIDKLLSGAVRIWIKSQVSTIEKLIIKITSKDRQIIRGSIPKIAVSAENTVYQELHISQVTIEGTEIEVNLPQIIKKKPFKLLKPIVVQIKVLLSEADLQKSLASPLLSAGLNDIWNRILTANGAISSQFHDNYEWDRLFLSESLISFSGTSFKQANNYKIEVSTEIKSNTLHSLLISPVTIATIPQQSISSNKTITLDLGTQVSITHLKVTPQYLSLEGTITIFP